MEEAKNGRILLNCDRKGTYRNKNAKKNQSSKSSRSTGSKKCSCPFLLKGKEFSHNERWGLLVVCDFHNHLAAENFEGHSFVGRLSEEEEKLVVDMSKTQVWSRDILHTLKQRNNLNASTLRIVYNARKKHRIIKYAGRSQMQQLLKNLSEQ